MKRPYSLFVKIDGKYHRISKLAMLKPQAIRFFQNALLGGSMKGFAMYLRPVKDDDTGLKPEVNDAAREKVFPNA